MLISVDTGRPITKIPHLQDYLAWRKRLTDAQYQAMVDELNSRVEGGEVHTSSWIPGSDWGGTVFQPIYDAACNRNPKAAALFFGLVLWDVMMRREDCWAYGRFEKNGIPIEGLTYFRVDCP